MKRISELPGIVLRLFSVSALANCVPGVRAITLLGKRITDIGVVSGNAPGLSNGGPNGFGKDRLYPVHTPIEVVKFQLEPG